MSYLRESFFFKEHFAVPAVLGEHRRMKQVSNKPSKFYIFSFCWQRIVDFYFVCTPDL